MRVMSEIYEYCDNFIKKGCFIITQQAISHQRFLQLLRFINIIHGFRIRFGNYSLIKKEVWKWGAFTKFKKWHFLWNIVILFSNYIILWKETTNIIHLIIQSSVPNIKRVLKQTTVVNINDVRQDRPRIMN